MYLLLWQNTCKTLFIGHELEFLISESLNILDGMQYYLESLFKLAPTTKYSDQRLPTYNTNILYLNDTKDGSGLYVVLYNPFK